LKRAQTQLAGRAIGCGNRFEIASRDHKMPRVLDDGGSRFRWSDCSAGATDEYCADFTFECADSLCDRRGGQVKPPGSFGDRSVIDRYQKGL
jgi:hypothetical protein